MCQAWCIVHGIKDPRDGLEGRGLERHTKRSRRFYEPAAPRSRRKSLMDLDRDLRRLGLLAVGELDGQPPMLEGRRRFLRFHIGWERERAGGAACGHWQ